MHKMIVIRGQRSFQVKCQTKLCVLLFVKEENNELMFKMHTKKMSINQLLRSNQESLI